MSSSPLPTGAPTGAGAAARNTAIANWASSIPPAHPQSTYAPSNVAAATNMAIAHWASSIPPPPNVWALRKISSALRSLGNAQLHINAGRDNHRARNHGAAARHFLEQMVRCVGEAQARLRTVGYANEYVERQLRRVLRDARASVRSTFGDFRVADRNCEFAEYRMEMVVARMGREYD